MTCTYCFGEGYVTDIVREGGEVFKKNSICVPCAGTGMPAEAQMRMFFEQRAERRDRALRYSSYREELADQWDERQDRLRRTGAGARGFEIVTARR